MPFALCFGMFHTLSYFVGKLGAIFVGVKSLGIMGAIEMKHGDKLGPQQRNFSMFAVKGKGFHFMSSAHVFEALKTSAQLRF